MIQLGKSYDAEELAKLCGQAKDLRYGHYAFVGDKATVIAEDEGNGVVKVTHIISQTPTCPSCGKDIHTIFTSRTVHLVYVDGQWREEQVDHYFTAACPECYEEFSPEELDKLGVPSGIR